MDLVCLSGRLPVRFRGDPARWRSGLARRLRGKQGLAATLIVLVGALVIVAPTGLLAGSLGDWTREFVRGVQTNTLQVPAPHQGVEGWPIVGEKIYAFWSTAHSDLPALVQSMQPKIGDLATWTLGFVAGIAGGILKFLASWLIAGVIMAFGEAGARSSEAIFARIISPERAPGFVILFHGNHSRGRTGRYRRGHDPGHRRRRDAVRGWSPVAGSARADRPDAAQIPALLVTVPAILYIWTSGDYSHASAIVYSVVLFVAGILDNVLKPLMLGRGVNAPMPVILLGALGGMASAGLVGLFVGAVLLALGYQIFMGWVHHDASAPESQPVG